MTSAIQLDLYRQPQNEDDDITQESRPAGFHTISAVIPAYNEARSIGSVVAIAKKYVDQVIVVDDGSTDMTAEIARRVGAVVVEHDTNSGKGTALNTGFQKARELFYPGIIVVLDGDWQHLPEELPQVLDPIMQCKADIVIGSRYLEETSNVPLKRVIGHRGFNQLINTFSGTNVTDSQSGFRAFSANAVKNIRFGSAGFSVEAEMQFLAHSLNLSVMEVPITIRYEDKPKRNVFGQGFTVLGGIVALVSQHRPLLFFSIAGIVSIIMAAVLGIWATQIYASSEQLAIAVTVLVVTLLVTSNSLIMTGLVLHSIRSMRSN